MLFLKHLKEVQTFLSRYDNSYFFEVTPIVDNGGFASLKLIKSKKVGVEDSEIDRITGLANIGLGKARAKAGGDLVGRHTSERVPKLAILLQILSKIKLVVSKLKCTNNHAFISKRLGVSLQQRYLTFV